MNIFITGGAGFIGINTAAYYLKKGDNVTIYDSLYRPGVQTNLDWLQKEHAGKPLNIIKADILDQKKLAQSIKDQQLVFHLAGQTAVTTSIKNPRLDFEFNALGTFNVLEAIRQNTPKATMLTSSTNKVYGDLDRLKIEETDTRFQAEDSAVKETEPLQFYSPYGCSKGTSDQYTLDYHRIYGLNTVVFRQSCIYGTHQLGVEDQGWLAHFAASFIKGRGLNIFGTGKQVRDALYIDDLVKAYDQATSSIDKTAGQAYNIGGGMERTISLLELISLLEKISCKSVDINYQDERPGDQKIYISDTSKAKQDFGWQPEISVQDGVGKLYSWLETIL